MLKEKIILASKSLRRQEILRAVGWEFEVISADNDETRLDAEDAVSYVRRLARTKAETIAGQFPERLVIAADTVVVIDGEILGQPGDDDDARRMLRLLSGNWHDVLTGVALMKAGDVVLEHETTRVRFSEMSDEEVDWYVATGEPRGKAGAYGIQGPAALFIKEIQGDYFNVVGLPVRLVFELSRRI
jgi:septum formation protein